MRRTFETADDDAPLDLTIRQVRLARVADAKAILHARSTERPARSGGG